MLKLLLLCAALAVVVTAAGNTCSMTKNKLTTFADLKHRIKFGCKFHAIRGTVCGKYKINLTPGLKLVHKGRAKKRIYVVERMWFSSARTDNGLKISGVLNFETLQQYFGGITRSPYKKKDGYLSVSKVYNISADCTTKEVTVQEKGGDFTLKYQMFDGRKAKTSRFSFTCHADNFKPTKSDRQICGNTTPVKVSKVGIAKSVFSNMNVVQSDYDCLGTTRVISSKKCKIRERDALDICLRAVGDRKFLACLPEPTNTLKRCVKYACSNFTEPNACYELRDQLSNCKHELPEISDKLEGPCVPGDDSGSATETDDSQTMVSY